MAERFQVAAVPTVPVVDPRDETVLLRHTCPQKSADAYLAGVLTLLKNLNQVEKPDLGANIEKI